MLLPHGPVGAGILHIADGAHTGVIEADVQTLLFALGHDCPGGAQVPVELVRHSRLHRSGSSNTDCPAWRSRAVHPLRISVTCQNQNRASLLGHAVTNPVFAATRRQRKRRKLQP